MWCRIKISKLTILILALAIIHVKGYPQSTQKLEIVESPNAKALNENISAIDEYNHQISEVLQNRIPVNQDSFLVFVSNTIKVAQNLGYKAGLAEANYYLGKFHIGAHSEYSMAIPALLQSLSTFEEIDDSLGIAKCYMQLGLISYITQYFEDAIKNFKLSLQYYNHATSNYLMAISYTELDDFDKAKHYFKLAIHEYKEINRPKSLSECYMYLGRMYAQESRFDSAHYYLKKAIRNQKMNFHAGELSRPYALISEYFYETHQQDSAFYYANTSLDLTKKGDDQLSAIIATKILSQIYEDRKQFEKAHHTLQLHYKLKNENMLGSTKQKIAEMQSMFDFKKKMAEEKQRHLEEIRKENRFKYILMISGVFFIMIAGGLWSRLQYVRKSKAALQHEKNISESLLLNILPVEIAQELKEKGVAQARNFEKVSVLFTDFVKFTEFSAKLSASELVFEINQCFKAFDHIIERYRIEKIKTIGDAYMAAGGLPVPTDDSIKNTVLAALEMQDFITKRKEELNSKGRPAFEMRVGIHTGPVVSGIVGVKKFQYDIWGDTVNTASRMETHGDIAKVNLSNDTYKLIKNTRIEGTDDLLFTFESRGKIQVKGKGELKMWFVGVKT